VLDTAVSKLVLADCGKEGKAACGSTQLCDGLEAGIEGAIHSIRKQTAQDRSMEFEDWEINDDLWRNEAEEGETPPWETSVEEAFQDAYDVGRRSRGPTHFGIGGCRQWVQLS
jgi:hypothetical protein